MNFVGLIRQTAPNTGTQHTNQQAGERTQVNKLARKTGRLFLQLQHKKFMESDQRYKHPKTLLQKLYDLFQ